MLDVTIARLSIVAIINPISGAGADRAAASKRAALVESEAQRRGLHAQVHFTERAGHARELAEASAQAGAALVIVWGGDGTLNEAGAGLIGSTTALGLVPAGSGNGLAAALGTPHEPVAALAAAFDGVVRTIDAGTFAGRAFFNIAGIGGSRHTHEETPERLNAMFSVNAAGPLYLSHAEVERAARIVGEVVATREWDQPRFKQRAKVV